MRQVLTTRARDQGSRPPPSWLAETLGKDRQAPAPSWPPTPSSLPSHAAPAHRSAASTSPTAAARGSSAPCSCPPSPPCAPTPSPGPTTSANETKANRLGPGRPHLGPPPHPDPARHDPRWSPLHPTTSHKTTHSRLTHHIGAPPSVAPACAAAGRCSASRSHCIYLVDTSPRTLICANHQFCRWGVRHGFAGSMHSISGETPASQTISMVVHNVSDHDLDYWRKTMW